MFIYNTTLDHYIYVRFTTPNRQLYETENYLNIFPTWNERYDFILYLIILIFSSQHKTKL